MSTARSSRCRGAEIGVTLVLPKSPAQVCSIENTMKDGQVGQCLDSKSYPGLKDQSVVQDCSIP